MDCKVNTNNQLIFKKASTSKQTDIDNNEFENKKQSLNIELLEYTKYLKNHIDEMKVNLKNDKLEYNNQIKEYNVIIENLYLLEQSEDSININLNTIKKNKLNILNKIKENFSINNTFDKSKNNYNMSFLNMFKIIMNNKSILNVVFNNKEKQFINNNVNYKYNINLKNKLLTCYKLTIFKELVLSFLFFENEKNISEKIITYNNDVKQVSQDKDLTAILSSSLNSYLSPNDLDNDENYYESDDDKIIIQTPHNPKTILSNRIPSNVINNNVNIDNSNEKFKSKFNLLDNKILNINENNYLDLFNYLDSYNHTYNFRNSYFLTIRNCHDLYDMFLFKSNEFVSYYETNNKYNYDNNSYCNLINQLNRIAKYNVSDVYKYLNDIVDVVKYSTEIVKYNKELNIIVSSLNNKIEKKNKMFLKLKSLEGQILINDTNLKKISKLYKSLSSLSEKMVTLKKYANINSKVKIINEIYNAFTNAKDISIPNYEYSKWNNDGKLNNCLKDNKCVIEIKDEKIMDTKAEKNCNQLLNSKNISNKEMYIFDCNKENNTAEVLIKNNSNNIEDIDTNKKSIISVKPNKNSIVSIYPIEKNNTKNKNVNNNTCLKYNKSSTLDNNCLLLNNLKVSINNKNINDESILNEQHNINKYRKSLEEYNFRDKNRKKISHKSVNVCKNIKLKIVNNTELLVDNKKESKNLLNNKKQENNLIIIKKNSKETINYLANANSSNKFDNKSYVNKNNKKLSHSNNIDKNTYINVLDDNNDNEKIKHISENQTNFNKANFTNMYKPSTMCLTNNKHLKINKTNQIKKSSTNNLNNTNESINTISHYLKLDNTEKNIHKEIVESNEIRSSVINISNNNNYFIINKDMDNPTIKKLINNHSLIKNKIEDLENLNSEKNIKYSEIKNLVKNKNNSYKKNIK